MKREHFDWLWGESESDRSRIVIDPESLGIPQEEFQPWVENGVLSQPFEPERIIAPRADMKGLLTLESNRFGGAYVIEDPFEAIYKIWEKAVGSPLAFSTGQKYQKYVDVKYRLFHVSRENLAAYITGVWGISYHYLEIPPTGNLIGWKDEKSLVVIIAKHLDTIQLPTALIDIRKNLITFFKDPKTRKAITIWAIELGPIRLTWIELRRLADEGVHYRGTKDFLTDEGEPIWEETEYMTDNTGKSIWELLEYNELVGIITLGEKLVRLTGKRKLLFEILYANCGEIVGRDQLINHLWPEDSKRTKQQKKQYHDHNLTQQASALRNDLRPLGIEVKIEHGIGYRLIALDNRLLQF